MSGSDRIAIVILTHNRRTEILRTLENMLALAETATVCVVDNASGDGTGEAIARRFPAVRLLSLSENQGAAGRNHGVRAVLSPYVAFCDDDTWWALGSLGRAVTLLDAHPWLDGGQWKKRPTPGFSALSLPPLRLPGNYRFR